MHPIRIVFSHNSQEVICALEALTSAPAFLGCSYMLTNLEELVKISLKADP